MGAVGPRCAAGGARQCHWAFGAVFEVKPSWRVPPTQAVLLESDHGHSWPFKFRSCSVWSGSCWTEAERHRLDPKGPASKGGPVQSTLIDSALFVQIHSLPAAGCAAGRATSYAR